MSLDNRLHESLQGVILRADPQEAWRRLEQRKRNRVRRRWIMRATALASIVMVVGFITVRWPAPDRVPPARVIAAPPPPTQAPAQATGGRIETVMGDGLNGVTGVAVGPAGELYATDYGHHQVVKHMPDGRREVVAGSDGFSGYEGDGGPARAARLFLPSGLALDAVGNLYIADTGNDVVRKVSPDGTISSVAGTNLVDDGLGLVIGGPSGVAVDDSGALYVAGGQPPKLIRITPDGGRELVAGGRFGDSAGDGGLAIDATLANAKDVEVHGETVFVVDLNAVRRIDSDGRISSVSGEMGDPTPVPLYPTAVAVTADGTLFIADAIPSNVRRVTPNGDVSIVAGTNWMGASGDGGPALDARLDRPTALAVDANGTLYIGEHGGCRVRRIRPPMPGQEGAPRSDPRMLIPTYLPPGFEPGPVQESASGSVVVEMSESSFDVVCSNAWTHNRRYFAPSGADGRPRATVVLSVHEGANAASVATAPLEGATGEKLTIRGRQAIYVPPGDGGPPMLSWLEEPDLAIQLWTRVAPGDPEVPREQLVAMAEGLVRAR